MQEAYENKQKDLLYFIHNDQIVSGDTGELISEEDFHNIFHEEITNKLNDYKKACRDIEKLPQLGIRKLQGSLYACFPIKNKYQYNKVFRGDMRELLKTGLLGKNELAFIGCFTSFIDFPTNAIIVDKEYLTLEEMGRMIGVGKNAMTSTLDNLEKNEVVKVIKRHKLPPVVYFNPFLHCAGKVVEYDTYMLFKDSIFNPNKSVDDEDKEVIREKREKYQEH
ncbi:hypothetical protein [Heyndrickxia camelliae]|uniref:Uncharacterized protein n=1 Tax=Heyndrickxia camelliae TaxID=1707093 RepID=A0A2N3LDB1_9BACI|nr:hypothetical protein [Heyndrickxia camelliae]PKR82608.1 hypothetical protein CWO92_23540 [Heyndrickxia camelliae]